MSRQPISRSVVMSQSRSQGLPANRETSQLLKIIYLVKQTSSKEDKPTLR